MKYLKRNLFFFKTLLSYLIGVVPCFFGILKNTIIHGHLKRLFRYPLTIQLPITWKCNFDCVMCGMHQMIHKVDFTPSELKMILSDKLFKKIRYVGINGGEPFIREDLCECIDTVIESLPKLKTINIITNGYFTEKILLQTEKIKTICNRNHIFFTLSVSIDGVTDMQDYMRGKQGVWSRSEDTVLKIMEDKSRYCNDINVICTITKHNIARIEEVEVWAKKNRVEVAYNIATVNERIHNKDKADGFLVLGDQKARMLSQEFFYKKFTEKKSMRYYAIFRFLRDNVRLAPCDCQQNKWVTLMPDSQISYCATHSKNLGSALEKSSFDIFNGNIQYLEEIKATYCSTCSHYMYTLSEKGKIEYYRELIRLYKVLW